MPGVAAAYVIASGSALIVVLFRQRRLLAERPRFSREFAGEAMRVWAPLSASTLIVRSAGKLDRVLLGLWWSPENVAFFFAASELA